jgi:hypothetical protein
LKVDYSTNDKVRAEITNLEKQIGEKQISVQKAARELFDTYRRK